MFDSLIHANPARLSRFAALAVCAAAGLACVWLLVRLLWLALPQGDVTATPAVPTRSAASKPVLSVAKWHLFGNAQNLALTRLAREAPATTLRLTLRGTWALSDPRQGIAMIQDEQGNEQAYKVGDTVTAGAKLTEVYPDHVVLNHEGADETLNLPRPEQHEVALPAANQRAIQAGRGHRASSLPPGYIPPRMAHGAVDWSRVQQRLRIDPQQLARQVHVESVFDHGKLAGVHLSGGGRVAELMQQAGLRSSDLITAVNGTRVSLSDAQQLMQNLGGASRVQVTVLRDGKPATLTLNLQ